MRATRGRVGLSVVVLVALCLPLSAWSAGRAPDVGSAPSTGTVLTLSLPVGACAQRRMFAVVKVTDAQRRPLARVRVAIRGGTWIAPASGVTGATGKVTLELRPLPFRRGPVTLITTASPTDRPAVKKQRTLPAC